MSIYRLCIVTETYIPDINGVAKSLECLIKHINPDVFDISIVRTAPKSEYTPELQELWCKGLTLPQYPDVQLGLPASRKIKTFWKENPPDLVYIATEGPLGLSAFSIAKKRSVPVISAFHTNFHSYSSYYRLGWIQKLVMGWLRRFHNKTSMTLVPSKIVQQELQSQGFERVEWLPHGVDCQSFHPRYHSSDRRDQWGVNAEEKVLLFVGRTAPEKNLTLAILAWQAMKNQGHPVHLVVVGDGPMRLELEKKHPDVHFMGMQTGKDLSECFASADIFLMPSQTETFGLVTLEAMASGLPIVSFDLAAASEFVRSDQEGQLAKGLSNEDFIQALSLLLEDDQLNTMGSRARARAETASWANVAQKFELICSAIIENNSQLLDDVLVQTLQ